MINVLKNIISFSENKLQSILKLEKDGEFNIIL